MDKKCGLCEGILETKEDIAQGYHSDSCKWNNIPKYKVTCICNTEVEVEENSVGECPNCYRGIDDKGVMQ